MFLLFGAVLDLTHCLHFLSDFFIDPSFSSEHNALSHETSTKTMPHLQVLKKRRFVARVILAKMAFEITYQIDSAGVKRPFHSKLANPMVQMCPVGLELPLFINN